MENKWKANFVNSFKFEYPNKLQYNLIIIEYTIIISRKWRVMHYPLKMST